MWRLMLLLIVGETDPVRTVVSEHPTRQACVVAAHNHRVQAIKTDEANTMRVYWCAKPEEPKGRK